MTFENKKTDVITLDGEPRDKSFRTGTPSFKRWQYSTGRLRSSGNHPGVDRGDCSAESLSG